VGYVVEGRRKKASGIGTSEGRKNEKTRAENARTRKVGESKAERKSISRLTAIETELKEKETPEKGHWRQDI